MKTLNKMSPEKQDLWEAIGVTAIILGLVLALHIAFVCAMMVYSSAVEHPVRQSEREIFREARN